MTDPEPVDGIWTAVGALPPKQRAAVALRYACDLPHVEIAAALGCSPEAARRSLHKGDQATAKGAGMRAELQRLTDRAAAENLLDVAYTTMDSPVRTVAAGRDSAWAGEG